MKVIKKVFEKISGQKIFSPQISRKKIFNRKIFTYKPGTIQATLMIAFSVVSAVILLCMGSVMYLRFSSMSQKEILENNQRLMDQTVESVEDYLINMRQVSDALYYNIIKESDMSSESDKMHNGMNLLYEANKENLRSIAIYNQYGSLLEAEPVVAQKEDPNVTKQDWFIQAMNQMENIHFSTPHVQNLFDDGTQQYYWVISSSRVVELTDGTNTQLGVLLVDMDYSGISRMMERINTTDSGQYFYLCDSNGQIIYHPHQVQLDNGMKKESSKKAARAKESVYEERINGEHREIVVDTIGYTGWKLVCVMPYSIFSNKMLDVKHFVLILILLMAMMLTLINRLVSVRISRPIMKLNNSVTEYEEGKEPEIYIGGSREIRHLGRSIQDSYKQNNALMQKIVWEQTERRKSELEVLQSQINPHFYYNSLSSIMVLAENGDTDTVEKMCRNLSRIMRYITNTAETTVTLREELDYVQKYLYCMKVRYQSSLNYSIDVDESLLDQPVPKLIIQPIVENAIKYGSDCEPPWTITISSTINQNSWQIDVTDTGPGFTEKAKKKINSDIMNAIRNPGMPALKINGLGTVNVFLRWKLFCKDDIIFRYGNTADGHGIVSIGRYFQTDAEE